MTVESPESAPHLLATLDELLRGSQLRGVAYSSILLNSDSAAVTGHDPTTILEREYATFYWPQNHPEPNLQWTTISLADSDKAPQLLQPGEAVTRTRNLLLGASVGATALSRVSTEMQRGWDRFRSEAYPMPAILHAAEICTAISVPLGVCEFGRAVSSRTAPTGAQTMRLWYPSMIHPRPVLERMKLRARQLITAEQPSSDGNDAPGVQ